MSKRQCVWVDLGNGMKAKVQTSSGQMSERTRLALAEISKAAVKQLEAKKETGTLAPGGPLTQKIRSQQQNQPGEKDGDDEGK